MKIVIIKTVAIFSFVDAFENQIVYVVISGKYKIMELKK